FEPIHPTDRHAPGELLNLLTHGFGLMLSLVAVDWMLAALAGHHDTLRVAGCILYVITLLAVYAASTLSHSFRTPRLRHLFRTIDQVCIFFLIAGTYTPWGLTFFFNPWGKVLMAAVWGMAFLGAGIKLFVKGHDNVAVAFYVIQGWLPVLAISEFLQHCPAGSLLWMVAGGFFYTFGTYFLARDEHYSYFHAIWHLLVIAGSACHFYAVLHYVVPYC
ncbi:MAG TPA: hemolysin III family protein, partial [Pirellulales bacterium]|nr:hemolysin III family protein [Pirellulales bacterium]